MLVIIEAFAAARRAQILKPSQAARKACRAFCIPRPQKYVNQWPFLRLPNVALLMALWSLLDGIWGILKRSWGVPVGLVSKALSFYFA